MNISLKAHHLVRYKQILALFFRYAHSDVAKEMAHADFMTEDELAQLETGGRPEQLADDLEKMGPTFVKVGQLLSSRADLLPEAYLKGLARLQDKVKPFPYNESEFRRKAGKLVAEQNDSTLRQMDVGRALLEVGRIAADTGLYVPTELTMLGKTLLQLDEVGRTLAPGFNPNAAVRRNVSETMRQRMFKNLSPAKLLGSVLELKDFLTGLPLRLNKILDAVANAELELKIKTPDTEPLMAGFQKIANRITTGLVLTALIIGASLLMQVPTSFRIFGYPGIAMRCFMLAAAGGLWLVLSIVIKDHKDKKKTRH